MTAKNDGEQPPMETVYISLGERSYPIYIGKDLLGQGKLLSKHICGGRALVVCGKNVPRQYLDTLLAGLGAIDAEAMLLDDSEQHKSLDGVHPIYDKLLAGGHGRDTAVIALGGGVTGDMAGFAAATYQRGVDFIQVPTTFLAQVDASVGGKTGVNHPRGKNMIGAFHQPRCVVIDIGTLDTLPDAHRRAGMAEVIKYGLIRDAKFFQWLEQHMPALLEGKEQLVTEAVRRSCENKAAVVAADEQESGMRALLNLGHTFGHAIETAQGYSGLLHGEAVAVGIMIAARLSVQMGLLCASEAERIEKLLRAARLQVQQPADVSISAILENIKNDKKAKGGKLRLVLLRAIGLAELMDSPGEAALKAALER